MAVKGAVMPGPSIHGEGQGAPLVDASTSVLIVQSQALVGEALGAALAQAQEFDLLGVAPTISAALDLCHDDQPALAVVDHALPDGGGDECARRILELVAGCGIVMVATIVTEAMVRRAVRAGCLGFVDKSSHLDELVGALRAALRHEPYLPSALLLAMMDQERSPTVPAARDLTEREQDVLRGLAHGRSSEEIAATLHMSRHTVRNHIRNLLAKLGAHSQLQAVVVAVREHLLEVDDLG